MGYTYVVGKKELISQKDEKYIIATFVRVTKMVLWLFIVGGGGILLLALLPDITIRESLFLFLICTIFFLPVIYFCTLTTLGIRIYNRNLSRQQYQHR